MKVEQFTNSRGNKQANHFTILENAITTLFQSYDSIIVKKDWNGETGEYEITLDENKWDYSPTTSKHRNYFMGETTKETERKIASGEYKLADLNA